jgi:hypothetical protein
MMWQARAIRLAEEKHLTGTARHLGYTPDAGARIYKVPSRTAEGLYHIVLYYPGIKRAGIYYCDCVAGGFDRACSHAGAVVHAERQRSRAERENLESVERRWWLVARTRD